MKKRRYTNEGIMHAKYTMDAICDKYKKGEAWSTRDLQYYDHLHTMYNAIKSVQWYEGEYNLLPY